VSVLRRTKWYSGMEDMHYCWTPARKTLVFDDCLEGVL